MRAVPALWGEREEAARVLRELIERYPEEHVLVALARRQLPSRTANEPLTLAERVEPHEEFDEFAVRYGRPGAGSTRRR